MNKAWDGKTLYLEAVDNASIARLNLRCSIGRQKENKDIVPFKTRNTPSKLFHCGHVFTPRLVPWRIICQEGQPLLAGLACLRSEVMQPSLPCSCCLPSLYIPGIGNTKSPARARNACSQVTPSKIGKKRQNVNYLCQSSRLRCLNDCGFGGSPFFPSP